jgi:tetratricopeptide (TPR) repeat protein
MASSSVDAQQVSADLLKTRGNEALAQKNYSEAKKFYSDAIAICPNGSSSHIYYSNRALVYQKMGEYSLSLQDCDAALRRCSRYGKCFGVLGGTYALQGNLQAAVIAYEKAIELEPNIKSYKDARHRVVSQLERGGREARVQQQNAKTANHRNLYETLRKMDLSLREISERSGGNAQVVKLAIGLGMIDSPSKTNAIDAVTKLHGGGLESLHDILVSVCGVSQVQARQYIDNAYPRDRPQGVLRQYDSDPLVFEEMIVLQIARAKQPPSASKLDDLGCCDVDAFVTALGQLKSGRGESALLAAVSAFFGKVVPDATPAPRYRATSDSSPEVDTSSSSRHVSGMEALNISACNAHGMATRAAEELMRHNGGELEARLETATAAALRADASLWHRILNAQSLTDPQSIAALKSDVEAVQKRVAAELFAGHNLSSMLQPHLSAEYSKVQLPDAAVAMVKDMARKAADHPGEIRALYAGSLVDVEGIIERLNAIHRRGELQDRDPHLLRDMVEVFRLISDSSQTSPATVQPRDVNINISVRVWFGNACRVVSVSIGEVASVEELRYRIQESVGVPPHKQVILFDKCLMEDEHSLSEYGITMGSTVEIQFGSRGISKIYLLCLPCLTSTPHFQLKSKQQLQKLTARVELWSIFTSLMKQVAWH